MDKFVKRTKLKSGDDTKSSSTSTVDIDQESLSAQPEECPEPKKKIVAVSSDDTDTSASCSRCSLGSDVNLTSTKSASVTKKEKQRHQSYKADYSKIKGITRSIKGPFHARCTLCKVDFSISHSGAYDIKRHCATENHITNSRTIDQTPLIVCLVLVYLIIV